MFHKAQEEICFLTPSFPNPGTKGHLHSLCFLDVAQFTTKHSFFC